MKKGRRKRGREAVREVGGEGMRECGMGRWERGAKGGREQRSERKKQAWR